MTPDPRECSTSVRLGRCPKLFRWPKSCRKKGSSKKGNCTGAWMRRAERMVTTAGVTRSTTSANDWGAPVALETGKVNELFAEAEAEVVLWLPQDQAPPSKAASATVVPSQLNEC